MTTGKTTDKATEILAGMRATIENQPAEANLNVTPDYSLKNTSEVRIYSSREFTDLEELKDCVGKLWGYLRCAKFSIPKKRTDTKTVGADVIDIRYNRKKARNGAVGYFYITCRSSVVAIKVFACVNGHINRLIPQIVQIANTNHARDYYLTRYPTASSNSKTDVLPLAINPGARTVRIWLQYNPKENQKAINLIREALTQKEYTNTPAFGRLMR